MNMVKHGWLHGKTSRYTSNVSWNNKGKGNRRCLARKTRSSDYYDNNMLFGMFNGEYLGYPEQ